MARSPRIDYVSAWHHVINRGAARSDIFRDDTNRATFLDCVGEASKKSAVDVHAYCLMSNHYHLLVNSRSGRLSEFLRLFGGRYARAFNRRWNRDGPIFRVRGLSIEIESDSQLVATSRYIHLNPVVAGLISSSEDWRWSSASAHLTGTSEPAWLHTSVVLDMFSRSAPMMDYANYLLDRPDDDSAAFYRKHFPAGHD